MPTTNISGLSALRDAVHLMESISSMPVRHFEVFLIIAASTGTPKIIEIARQANVSTSIASRIIDRLGDGGPEAKEGLGLVVRLDSPYNARDKTAALTKAGKDLANRLNTIIVQRG